MQSALAALHAQALSQSQSFQNELGVGTSGTVFCEMDKTKTPFRMSLIHCSGNSTNIPNPTI